MMAMLVALFGTLVLVLGLLGAASPRRVITFAGLLRSPGGLYGAAALRIVLGVACILAAAESGFPAALRVIGVVAVAAGVALPFLGVERLGAIVDWWSRRPSYWMRAWCLVAAAFGAFLVFAVV